MTANDISKQLHTRARRIGGVLEIFAFTVMLLASPHLFSHEAYAGDSEGASSTAAAWRCERLAVRALGENKHVRRGLLHSLRTRPHCERAARRFELCGPVAVHASGIAATAGSGAPNALTGKLCVAVSCDSPERSSDQRMVIEGATGLRWLAASGIDRLCMDLD